jgi:energy-coupling factor transport system permease protein
VTTHAGAWACWYVAALLVASSSVHPLVSLGIIATSIAAVLSLTDRADRGSFRLMLCLGGVFIALRVVLFTVTGRAGSTTLVHLPEVTLPGILGGIHVGGALSAEVAVNELVEGLRLTSILAATGAFVAVTDVGALVRLLPRRLRHVGLVVQIAIAFLPALAASVREVREAQRARGLRVRGLRSAMPLVVPVVAGALDRAFALAESLHARGFDRPSPSRYRAYPIRPPERTLIAVALLAAAVGWIAAHGAAGSWSPHPTLSWPGSDPLLLVAPLLLLAPIPLVAAPREVTA